MTFVDPASGESGTGTFHTRRPDFKLLSSLTDRELRVLEHLYVGATNKEMSRYLFVTENTIKYHLKNIYGKLHVSNRLQALITARDLGLIDPA